VFTAQYEQIPYIKHVTFHLQKVKHANATAQTMALVQQPDKLTVQRAMDGQDVNEYITTINLYTLMVLHNMYNIARGKEPSR
jgi:hypothetical protein